MARLRKLAAEGVMEMTEEYPLVKNLILPISLRPGGDGWPVEEVNQEVGKWVARGYTLVTAFPYANTPDYIQVLYVLAKQP
jgi:hypothetical protein